MKKTLLTLGVIVLIGGGALAGVFYWKNLRGAGPALRPVAGDIADLLENAESTDQDEAANEKGNSGEEVKPSKPAVNETDFPLKLPDGFSISIIAKNLNTPRVMASDGMAGGLWVSEMNAGAVTLLEMKEGKVVKQTRVFKNLKRPHGLAFDPAEPSMLYIAEEDKISRARVYSEETLEKIIDLPGGGRHFSRTIGFGPDGRLYVSIGSSCDVCREEDERRAVMYLMNKDGSDFKLFAKGLRNTVFFTWNPSTLKIWGTDMGRDRLGDDLPPDEINIIGSDPSTAATAGQAGSGQEPAVLDYGWPVCYGKNIHDTNFDKNQYVRDPCTDMMPSQIDLPAHSAPLGLAFIPTEVWSEEYAGDLLVAYHGSWNRTEPTGYKVVRIKLDDKGNYEGAEDFISGWLTKDGGALGRPVDLLFGPDRELYISDDKAGVIYKVTYIR